MRLSATLNSNNIYLVFLICTLFMSTVYNLTSLSSQDSNFPHLVWQTTVTSHFQIYLLSPHFEPPCRMGTHITTKFFLSTSNLLNITLPFALSLPAYMVFIHLSASDTSTSPPPSKKNLYLYSYHLSIWHIHLSI